MVGLCNHTNWLKRRSVPGKIFHLILDYYNNFQMRVYSVSLTSEWHRLDTGIITDRAASVFRFAIAMNMVVGGEGVPRTLHKN